MRFRPCLEVFVVALVVLTMFVVASHGDEQENTIAPPIETIASLASQHDVKRLVRRSLQTIDCQYCLQRRCFQENLWPKRKLNCEETWGCGELNCKWLQCKKCTCKGCFEGNLSERLAFKCKKWGCSALYDCKPVCTDRKQAPTAIRIPKDDEGRTQTKLAGKTCSRNTECKSNTCRNGVCMASPACYPLKHDFGVPFDTNKVNIVFVGSGFDSAGSQAWQQRVDSTYAVFGRYKMFSLDTPQFNVFYVNPAALDSSFCYFGCQGIDRLLCCDIAKARTLSNKCFETGDSLQTVVIHNDLKYGGAGYTSSNLATTSIHPSGPLVAVHELGHSLFELADEYASGFGSPSYSNCAATSSCNRWKDLITTTPNGYNPVGCIPGCQGSSYYMAQVSFMTALDREVGAVNERFTCCTYQALTKSMPRYCNAFNPQGDYLLNYCRNNDYQGYGDNYDAAPQGVGGVPPIGIPEKAGANYIYLERPLLVTVGIEQGVMGAEVIGTPSYGRAGLYRRRNVKGDFPHISRAALARLDSVIKVRVFFEDGVKNVLLFAPNATVEVPPGVAVDAGDDTTLPPPPDEPLTVSEMAGVLDVALDTKGRTVESIVIKVERT